MEEEKHFLPRMKRRKKGRGQLPILGTRLSKYGLTREERAVRAAPEEATLPEALVYGWLTRQDIPFEFQVSVMGGRAPGGAIVDFIIHLRMPPLVLRIQGYYWHTLPGQIVSDDLQRDALEMYGYQVEDVWDFDVGTADKCHWTMLGLLYGVRKPTGLRVSRPDIERACPRCGRKPACIVCKR